MTTAERTTDTEKQTGDRVDESIIVERNAVLTAWTRVVAERLGYGLDEALSLAGAVGSLPYFQDPEGRGPAPQPHQVETMIDRENDPGIVRERKAYVDIMQRPVPVVVMREGVRALSTPQRVVEPAGVASYLKRRLREHLEPTLGAMRQLAHAHPPAELARRATELYTEFRAELHDEQVGWLPPAKLRLERVRSLVPST
jgi:hypothetical protein